MYAPIVTKPSALASSLGLNMNGKRASSSPATKGVKKARTNTPPPVGAASALAADSPAMVRSNSAQSFVASGLSTTPVLGSPLNPHKYTKDVIGKPGSTAAPAGRAKIKVKTKSSLGNVAVGRAARASATPDAPSREASEASSRNEAPSEEEDDDEEDEEEDEDDNFSLDPSPTKRSGATAWEEDDPVSS